MMAPENSVPSSSSSSSSSSSAFVISSPQSVTAFALPQEQDDGKAAAAWIKEDILVLPKSVVVGNNESDAYWNEVVVPSSRASQRTKNPIRAVVDPIMALYHKQKKTQQQQQQQQTDASSQEFISLALGDPTSSGNFEPCPIVQQSISSTLVASTAGYVNALGTGEARHSIAQFHSNHVVSVQSSQVIVASGCSGALQIILQALLDPETYLLVPNPGFPLYQVICENLGAHVLPYSLLPHDGWNVDVNQVQCLVEEYRAQGKQIRAMLVNNPSNPTGAVYSREHLEELVQLCNVCRLPLVADEIYGDLTYDPHRPFIPLANIVANLHSPVPVITCSGIGKQFLVPGWRVGWAIFHDNAAGSLANVQHGAQQLAQIVLGASHLAQTMAVKILKSQQKYHPEMKQWQQSMRHTLATNATRLVQQLSQAPGLHVSPAQGAMYVMVTLDERAFDFLTTTDTTTTTTTTTTTVGEQFVMRLLQEEQVFVLPGSCFGMANAVRIVFCAPSSVLEQACTRIVKFCQRHSCAPAVP